MTSSEGAGRLISFTGQAVVVTGAGRGLGRQYVLELARRGASVVVNDIDQASADAVVSEIGEAAVASYDSVADEAGGAAIIKRAISAFGRIDAIVSNAGIWRNADFGEMTASEFDAVLGIHLRGAFNVCRPAWEHMRAQGYGRIVLTSSSAGAFGRPHGANYCAAKAALLGFGRALAIDGTAHGIRVNCILPVADTSIERTNVPPSDAPERGHDEAVLTVWDRLGSERSRPTQAAPLVALLASRECSVSGEAFSSAGGRYARLIVGLTDGWLNLSETHAATAEQILDNWREIEDHRQLLVPTHAFEEIESILQRLNRLSAEPTPRP